jgi:glycolate oxidase iron-sulfur subunit
MRRRVGHIDSCLSCLSCMTTCAVKVDYAHLIDLALAHVEENFRRPLTDRLLRALLARVLPEPRLFALALSLARAVAPLRLILPRRVGPLFDMLPERADMRSEIMTPQTFPAEGARRARVCLLAGCVQQVLAAQINRATIRLLNRHGCEVIIAAGSGCCGSLPLHMGYSARAKAMAAANIDAWSRAGDLDAILANASGCGTTVKDYGHLLADDVLAQAANGIASRARDVTEFVHGLGFKPTGVAPYRVVYQVET